MSQSLEETQELYKKAESFKKDGNLEEAIATLEELLAGDDTFALAHSAMAVMCVKVGRYEDAAKHCQKVCELEPNDAFSFTAMSVIFQRIYAATQDTQFIQLAEDAMARSRMISGGM